MPQKVESDKYLFLGNMIQFYNPFVIRLGAMVYRDSQ